MGVILVLSLPVGFWVWLMVWGADDMPWIRPYWVVDVLWWCDELLHPSPSIDSPVAIGAHSHAEGYNTQAIGAHSDPE